MTKRLLFILSVLIFLIASHNTNAQIIKGEAFLGLNMSQVDGDEVVGFKMIPTTSHHKNANNFTVLVVVKMTTFVH